MLPPSVYRTFNAIKTDSTSVRILMEEFEMVFIAVLILKILFTDESGELFRIRYFLGCALALITITTIMIIMNVGQMNFKHCFLDGTFLTKGQS